MAATVDRCKECGQFVYRLELLISREVISICAGTKKAFVIDDIEDPQPGIFGLPVMKLTKEVPAEVFVRHVCQESG